MSQFSDAVDVSRDWKAPGGGGGRRREEGKKKTSWESEDGKEGKLRELESNER